LANPFTIVDKIRYKCVRQGLRSPYRSTCSQTNITCCKIGIAALRLCSLCLGSI